jgi:hypothetical protein
VKVKDGAGKSAAGGTRVLVGEGTEIDPEDDITSAQFENIDVSTVGLISCVDDTLCQALGSDQRCLYNPATQMGGCVKTRRPFKGTVTNLSTSAKFTWTGTAEIPTSRKDGLEIQNLSICPTGATGSGCHQVFARMAMPFYTIETTGLSKRACDLGFYYTNSASPGCEARLKYPGIKLKNKTGYYSIEARWIVNLQPDKPGYCDAKMAVTYRYRLAPSFANLDFWDLANIAPMQPEVFYQIKTFDDIGCTKQKLVEFAAHQRFDVEIAKSSASQLYKDDDCKGYEGSVVPDGIGNLTKETWSRVMNYGGQPGVFDSYHERNETTIIPFLTDYILIPGCTLPGETWGCLHVHWRWGAKVAKRASKDYTGKLAFFNLVPTSQSIEVAVVSYKGGEFEPPAGSDNMYSVLGLLGSSLSYLGGFTGLCNDTLSSQCSKCVAEGSQLSRDRVLWMVSRSKPNTSPFEKDAFNRRTNWFFR